MISIGIYINEDRFSFAELSLEKAYPKLLSFGEHFFENAHSKEEIGLFISHHLEKIEKKHKGKSLHFCYGLSQSFVTSFFVELPFKEKFKILKTLPFEIEDKSPFRPDKVFFDARICKIKDKNKSSALCFVTPEDNVNEFLELSNHLKTPPYLLSCEGSALANLLESWNKPLSQIQNPMAYPLYIYLGVQNSQLLLYKEGHLSYISVLDWSVTPIVREMEKLYKLTAQKAWEEFFGKSFILSEAKGFTKEQVFFSNLIKKHIHRLIPKLKLLKMSFETKWKTQIEKAVLFGPGAMIKNLSAFLTTEISIDVFKLKTLANFPHFEWDAQPSVDMALGLALEGLKRSPYPGLNFLQSIKKEDFFLFPRKWQKAGMYFFLCFFIFMAYAFVRKQESSKVLNKVESVFADYGKKIALIPESQMSVESFHSFLEKEKEKIKNERIVQDKLNRPHPMDDLHLIVQKLGSASQWNLTIRYLKVENKSVEIKGLVNRSSLENFKAQLQSLAKGKIKEDFAFQNEWGANPNPDGEDTLTSTTQKKETRQNGLKRSVWKEKKDSEASDQKEGPERKERAFFSYSFEMKEGL